MYVSPSSSFRAYFSNVARDCCESSGSIVVPTRDSLMESVTVAMAMPFVSSGRSLECSMHTLEISCDGGRGKSDFVRPECAERGPS